jgi:hypothetical protein
MALICVRRVRNCALYRFGLVFHCLVRLTSSILADSRKPLGEPAPQVSNLALAIVILVVIVIQTFFVCRPAIIENLAYI